MTLRDFIAQLQALPPTSMDATVCVEYLTDEGIGEEPEFGQEIIVHAKYDRGWVTLVTESADGMD